MLDYIDFRDTRGIKEHVDYLVSKLRNLEEEVNLNKYENFTTIRHSYNKQYPIVIGQRVTTTIEYFQDREEQLAEIGRLLSLPGTRIVSIVGSGGIGKTALVSKFLYGLERNIWPSGLDSRKVDGILYLSHRTVGITLERIFLDCAEMLGGTKKNTLQSIWVNPKIELTEKIRSLIEIINDGTFIILLDNVEDLLDENGNFIVPELNTFFELSLAMPGDARLLITTREPINFSTKDAPLDKRILVDRGLETEFGIAMLRQSDPSGLYGLRIANDESLAKVVAMLHGVPRALEVFAGIVKDEGGLMTSDEIMEQFLKHPKTEKELIREGYRRLDAEARKVLEGLAVFSRPVPIMAIKYLLEPFMPEIDVTNLILRLIRIHMISVVDKERKLIALHPMDRDFAYSQIPEN